MDLLQEKEVSIHEALASPDPIQAAQVTDTTGFDPRGSREPRPRFPPVCRWKDCFDPRGSREPRRGTAGVQYRQLEFRSTRLSRAPTNEDGTITHRPVVSIHEALASPDSYNSHLPGLLAVSIHEALASPDMSTLPGSTARPCFDPRGSREPRPCSTTGTTFAVMFRSTRLSRAPTIPSMPARVAKVFRSTRLSRAPTPLTLYSSYKFYVSIHEALASPDKKTL